MRFIGNFQSVLKSTATGIFVFTLFSTAFVVGYIYIDYQQYLESYHATQLHEIETLQKKAKTTLGDLNRLLCLAEERILAAQGKPEQIQGILISLHSLQAHQALPEFQRLSYMVLVAPYRTITRFGVLPVDSAKVITKGKSPIHREPIFKFTDKTLEVKSIILNLNGNLEGVLELEIDLSAFKKFMGSYETIDFEPLPNTRNANQAQSFLIPLYSKTPDQFQAYAFVHKLHYSVFAFYTLLTTILIGFHLWFLGKCFQKSYQGRIKILEETVFEKNHIERTLREELGAYQLEAQVHQLTCQANKKIQSHRTERQRESANRMLVSLSILEQPFKKTFTESREVDQIGLVDACLQEAAALSGRIWRSMRKEEVDFKGILDDLLLLFAEKIHKTAIKVEINVEPQKTPFLGDPLLIEALLINAIGKPLRRVPKNGAISIELKEKLGFIHLNIQDNGFAGGEAVENLIRKPFELFMTDEAFHQTCLRSGIKYKTSRTSNGLNVSHLVISTFQEEAIHSNVVKLFS